MFDWPYEIIHTGVQLFSFVNVIQRSRVVQGSSLILGKETFYMIFRDTYRHLVFILYHQYFVQVFLKYGLRPVCSMVNQTSSLQLLC